MKESGPPGNLSEYRTKPPKKHFLQSQIARILGESEHFCSVIIESFSITDSDVSVSGRIEISEEKDFPNFSIALAIIDRQGKCNHLIPGNVDIQGKYHITTKIASSYLREEYFTIMVTVQKGENTIALSAKRISMQS